MKQIYKEQLFEKKYLVSDREQRSGDAFEVLFSFAALFGIRIIHGEESAQREMIPFISERLGICVPEPFYREFPDSLRVLSPDVLLFDQLLHYTVTYGLNLFNEAGHSLFEYFQRKRAFQEGTEIKDYSIITEEEAGIKISEIVRNLLLSSRPLNDKQYALVLAYLSDHDFEIEKCASKNTAIRLLAGSHGMRLLRFIALSDVIKLVDEINSSCYGNKDVKKLNLRNQDRKFITEVIDRLLDAGKCDVETCCEKKAIWRGLLHHIHYKPHDERSADFVACMHGKENLSVYARFEKAIERRDIKCAIEILREGKGQTAVLRNLSYLISRCSSQKEVDLVLACIDSRNVIVLLQLLLLYTNYSSKHTSRTFIFATHNEMTKHTETCIEVEKRRSVISREHANAISSRVNANLHRLLKGRLGKVYVDTAMRSMALPLQENTAQTGVGVLPKGSRIAIEAGKKIRAFVYWEMVDDIDLAVIGLDSSGHQTEFSWRTMYKRQSSAITFSGDQIRGYDGGSEYFDIDIKEFIRQYPCIRYLVLCGNVYSNIHFSECFCKAGFMLRDIDSSGEVFEPKTVLSSFLVNCGSTFAYLFGIDLEKSELVWLNAARQGSTIVAGTSALSFLTKYFDVTSVINMYTFFEMMATELVDDPSEAEIIVSDRVVEHDGKAEVIRSCDFDKMLALMNA